MKKLSKKFNQIEETVEAYASISTHSCGCSCSICYNSPSAQAGMYSEGKAVNRGNL
ncbi:putative bacteriocin precursor, CLI_3235 family [Clostridium cavendishii DSM 21758]|uniref:Putative bacteriocin, CLI_3235 family n=1 Tax=Clostridium cavendishii DSM 21758 TaxID=1121302 RepID=A0A1M6IUD8_9CLOT|nr:hypothetical protein [Clostridium cavendishii]SHJ38063.1 putative bacteriocin precursor, CLI_3235 family [Clostridium cavendishii DSM 21758]